MNIKIKKTTSDAIIPTKGSYGAAGCDLYSNEEFSIILYPGQSTMIHTGICVEIPYGYVGLVYPRSGLASKHGLRLSNCVGVIDSDYRGEILLSVRNDSNEKQVIEHKSRVAQLVITAYEDVNFEEVDELSDSKRGEGGFGSTGTK